MVSTEHDPSVVDRASHLLRVADGRVATAQPPADASSVPELPASLVDIIALRPETGERSLLVVGVDDRDRVLLDLLTTGWSVEGVAPHMTTQPSRRHD